MPLLLRLTGKVLSGCSEKLNMRYFLPPVTLVFVVALTGCLTTTSVKSLGSAEVVIGEKLSHWYAVSCPTNLSAENPYLVIQVLNLPEQKIEVRSKERVIQEINENTSAVFGLSILGMMASGIYWGYTHPMDWGGSEGANALATAPVVGLAAGALSIIGTLALDSSMKHEEERVSPNVKVISRLSNTSVPVSDVEVTVRIGKEQNLYRTDANGSVKVDLIKDFDLSRFNAGNFISFEVLIPQASFCQSGFLHFSEGGSMSR
ncbi:hypothetical protein HYR99_14850 [Candidatus Poribacteria bacterium]|nr:hypothetical protein [Candidatus Poribacteria bacterium]